MNLVKILKDGWFPDGTYFFIDMELCAFDLADFIQVAYGHPVSNSSTRVHSQLLSLSHAVEEISSSTSPRQLRFSGITNILTQITAGVKFMHSYNAIHRDLKPGNGT